MFPELQSAESGVVKQGDNLPQGPELRNTALDRFRFVPHMADSGAVHVHLYSKKYQ